MPSLAVSIDLDSPAEYAGLHGLDATHADPLLMYGAPLQRLVQLCTAVGGAATIFVIGRDLNSSSSAVLTPLVQQGFEIGCHSYHHDYHLSRAAPAVIRRELMQARSVLLEHLGTDATGFRAPGYHLSTVLLDALQVAGFRYDSSVLASPPYYAAKLAVLGAYRLRGRRSTSLLGSPRSSWAPRRPYHPGIDPYRRGSRPMVELPITVATPWRLPVTGASLALAPRPVRHVLVRALAHQRVVVLGLHGMDLVDAAADGLPGPLAKRQPELRVPVDRRLEILRTVIERLRTDHDLLTCAQIAASLAG